MRIPFTIERFLGIFEQYNLAIWPTQIVAYIIGALALAAIMMRLKAGTRIASLVLTCMWLVNGALYHLMFFSPINKAAWLFGALFIVQALLFLFFGTIRNQLPANKRYDAFSIIGLLFIAYAMAIYPILGILAGHGYPNAPMFGVAPCPTTIFTFGILLCMSGRIPGYLLIIPFLWAVVGFNAALSLGITEDIGLLIAGTVGTFLIIYRNRAIQKSDTARK